MMLKISEKERRFLLDNLENANDLINAGDLNSVLLPLDEWIAVNGFDLEYRLTAKGREAQQIYDSIYANNV